MTTPQHGHAISDLLDFWFGDALSASDPSGVKAVAARWFNGGAAFDQEIADKFAGLPDRLAAGEVEAWVRAGPKGVLAALIGLDQFPRNLFRGTPRAFAFDPLALKLSKQAIDAGDDKRLHPLERIFVYLPLEHSENLDDQRRSVALFDALRPQAGPPERDFVHEAWVYAVKHLEVIERFGRFPHRNAILDRPSTVEEVEFLKLPGSSF